MEHCKVEADIEEAPHCKQSTTTTTRSDNYAEEEWGRMNINIKNDDANKSSTSSSGYCCCHLWLWRCQGGVEMYWSVVKKHVGILLFSLVLFTVLCGVGISICSVFTKSSQDDTREDALGLATETGAWFSGQLDRALLPLFR